MMKISELVGGPQDGVKIVTYLYPPAMVYVTRRWAGDRFASWSREPDAKRFAVGYRREGNNYKFHSQLPKASK